MTAVYEPAGSGASGASAIVLVLFTVDMLFLPMFHIAGMPLKPFYLLLPFFGVVTAANPTSRIIAFLSLSMTAVLLLGGLWLMTSDSSAVISETIRNSIIWVIAAFAFAFGSRQRLENLNFFLWLIPAYFLLTLVLTFGYRQFPQLIAFYGLQEWVDTGLFVFRSPGIHFNANLSALAMNLLLLATVVGERVGLITARGALVKVLVFLCVLGLHVLTASRGEMGAALALGAAWVYAANSRHASQPLSRSVLRIALAVGVLVPLLQYAVTRLATVNPTFEFVERQFFAPITSGEHLITEEANPVLSSPIRRPFIRAATAFDRFDRSPIWGSGLDVASPYPFDETGFHNDWIVILVGGGIIGTILLLLILKELSSISPILLIPFLFTAPFNSFVLAPQHLTFFFAIAGLVSGQIYRRQKTNSLTDTQ